MPASPDRQGVSRKFLGPRNALTRAGSNRRRLGTVNYYSTTAGAYLGWTTSRVRVTVVPQDFAAVICATGLGYAQHDDGRVPAGVADPGARSTAARQHGSTVHGAAEVVTWTGAEARRMTYAEVGATAAQLAHALRDDLGVTGDQRVATFMWNNNEHLVAYFAVPSMGAVLHTLNIRLYPDQVAYIANHAEDADRRPAGRADARRRPGRGRARGPRTVDHRTVRRRR